MVRVEKIEGEKDLDEVRILFKEYLEELNENLCFQHTDEELVSPLKKYGQPHGSLLLAYKYDKTSRLLAFHSFKENSDF